MIRNSPSDGLNENLREVEEADSDSDEFISTDHEESEPNSPLFQDANFLR